MADEASKLQIDPIKFASAEADLNRLNQQYMESLGKLVQQAMDFNRDVSSFHERLLLVCLGILGVSLSSLLAFASKLSATPRAKTVLFHEVVPACILLLLAVITSRNVMAVVVKINRTLLTEHNKDVDNYYTQLILRGVNRLSNAVTGTMTHEDKVRPVSEVVGEVAANAQKTIDGYKKRPSMESLSRSDTKNLKWQARIAMTAMTIGLVLLGIAAIRFLLL